ncbi:MAG: hypothetical protein HWN66_22185 [Candidatus Helarchaeota archaeon]|nr:hypothetical protein [Candidatus Helarchaeota archaeon]
MSNESLKPKKKEEIKPLEIKMNLDKERTLKYRFRAIKLLEEKFEVPFGQLDKVFADTSKLKVDDIITLIWAGLIHEQKDLTHEQVYAMLDESDYSFMDVIALFAKGFGISTPELEALKKKALELNKSTGTGAKREK